MGGGAVDREMMGAVVSARNRRDFLLYPLKIGFPCGSAGQESACNVGDLGSTPGLGRSPGEGKAYPLQYSGLENSMDCIVQGVTKSWLQLSDFHFTCKIEDFPGGLVVKNLPTNAGDTGLIPDPGGFHMLWINKACAAQLLSPHIATTDAHSPGARGLQQEKPPQ